MTEVMEAETVEAEGTVPQEALPAEVVTEDNWKQVGEALPQDMTPPPADPYLAMIERIATDPTADLDKLERMLAMKQQLDAEAQKRAYFEAMAAAQAKMEPVARNKRNTQTDSNYSDLAEIYKACKPIAAAHGLSFSTYPAPTEKANHMGVRWVVRHAAGHSEEGTAELPLDDKGIKGSVNKTGVHAFGSTSSYARRYLFCMIFDVATTDDNDGNQGEVETVSEEQYTALRKKLDDSGMKERNFNLAFGHPDPDNADLHQFPAAKFDEAMKRLDAYAAAKAQAKKDGIHE